MAHNLYAIPVYTYKPDLSILGEAGLHLVDILNNYWHKLKIETNRKYN